MHFPYDQALAFYAVAKHGSFSKAAAELYRSQSAVSIQVAKLEATLGRRLLERTTKRLSLTEAGHILLGYIGQMNNLMQQAVQQLDDLDRLERGRLVLCTSDTTGCYRLPGMLQDYRLRHPGIDIVVRNATSPHTIQAVLEHEVDLGIVTLAGLKPGLEAIPLFFRHDVLICPPDHPLAGRQTLRLKDLERHPLILLDQRCSSRRIMDDLCEQARVQLKITMELSSIEVIKRFVRIDAGLSVVPAMSIQEELQTGVLAAVEISDFQGQPPHKMGVIYKQGRYLSLAAQSFVQELQEFFQTV
ncbi:HTH-type transcriptional activator CmpR [Candidatus Entotheonellaceae bacterium PAL068K]